MVGRKRQGLGVAVVEPRPRPTVRERPTRQVRAAFCPVCGTSHGIKRLRYRKGYEPGEDGDTTNFWEKTLSFDPDKPFGIIQEVGLGRGKSFNVIGYFGPEDDVDGYFPLVKGRLLQATREWLNKGWITREELLALVAGGQGPELESDIDAAVREILAERGKVKVTDLTAAVLMKLGLDEEATDTSRQRQAAGTNRKIRAVLWRLDRQGLCALTSLGRVAEWLGKPAV